LKAAKKAAFKKEKELKRLAREAEELR